MADALGDFFAKKGKKKVKASNLNVTAEAKKPETKKPKSKDAEEEGWEEEQVVASTMKVEVAGKLTHDEDKKEEEDTSAPAWGSVKQKVDKASRELNERRFPTLAKSMRVSSNINIDDGSDGKVNISTSKNVFAALENEEDEEKEVKRPKEIKPAMVKKKQGERETVALQRELDKYSSKKGGKSKKEPKVSDESGNEDSEEEEETEEPAEAVEVVKKRERVKKADPEAKKPTALKEEDEAKDDEDLPEDVKLRADLEACKAKYAGRKKPFPAKQLPRSELEEEKENKPKQQTTSKKKKAFVEEDFDKPKLLVADW
mmetsp:Transcript_26799/g.61045  ORF Transcript_26799/g.61045 Transcript_26799/m.61045 type:complete len:315 (-) Transcript_26799:164-1108(-)